MRWKWKGKGSLRRALPFLVGDAALIALALYVGFWLRFDGRIPARWLELLAGYWGIALAVKLPVFWRLGLYRLSWSHVSTHELTRVAFAVGLSSALLGALYFLLGRELSALGVDPLPRSVWLLDGLLSLVLVGGFRAAKRVYLGLTRRGSPRRGGRRMLIVGAGDAGAQLVRAMLDNPEAGLVPVGFVDDDPGKQGLALHGVPVLGPRRAIPELVPRYGVQELLIAMPSAPPRVIRETVELVRRAGLTRVRIVPGLQQLVGGRLTLEDVREVRLEDVLGRDPVRIEVKEVARYLRGKRVLVTGAAGSIGSELCRQIAKFGPGTLVALDRDESGLFDLEQELGSRLPELPLQVAVADICDPDKIERLFQAHRPQVVFHAAAYKHVPLMEAYPEEAVKTNVEGTLTVARAALRAQSEKFVLISTDKAVNPTSVMGATKRAAERIVQALNAQARQEERPTRYVAVRFGNVLGSRGSVFPLFQEQIKRGGPVTVTHPEMRRYFMLPAEAALLVLQAGAMGEGGEVFVLDMGEPVSVLELAREMIRLAGYEPDRDIPIVFTGGRPGEKLFEELLTAEEGTVATQHQQIFVARLSESSEDPEALWEGIRELRRAAEHGDRARILGLLKALVPTYRPDSAEPT